MASKNYNKKEASSDLRERAKIEKALTRLDIIRRELGMSQKEFARRIGLSETRYNTIERGTNTLAPAVAIRIALEFDVSLDYIYLMDIRRSLHHKKAGIDAHYSYRELMAARDLIDALLTDFASRDNDLYMSEKAEADAASDALASRVLVESDINKGIRARNAKINKKS